MALNIRDPEAQRLARALADATGETMTKAVIKALEERLERVRVREEVQPHRAGRASHGARQEVRRSACLGSALSG